MEITRGKIPTAQRVVIYGPEGIGKTTLAAYFPHAVFIDTEGSTRLFDVARYPAPNCWAMLLETVQHAMDHPEDHQTLVIDTADWAEKLCIEAVCQKFQKSGIEDFGYGKGYTFLKEEFAKLLTYLDGCIDAGIHVVLTAHAWLRKIEQPDEQGAYDHWELKLSKQCAPMVKEWADMVLFCNYKTLVVTDRNGKGKAQGGRRMMYTSHTPFWDAKNRHGLPEELPMEWSAIAPIFGPSAPQTAPQRPEPAAPVSVPAPQPAPIRGAEQHATPTQAPRQAAGTTTNGTTAAGSATMSPASAPIPLSPDDTPLGFEGIDPDLAQLMRSNEVTPAEIMMVVGAKGYFPYDMPVRDYPPEFVKGCLVAAWPQVFELIQQDREDLPF